MIKPRISLWLRRLLVIAFFLSVAICLLAIWLTGTLFGDPARLLPFWLLQVAADHRVLLLAASCLGPVMCYGALRHVTGDIMAVPERFLDERQKMVRDQAHRSAFRFIKLACCLIPALLAIEYLPWLRPAPAPAPAPATTVLHIVPMSEVIWVYTDPSFPISHTAHKPLAQAAALHKFIAIHNSLLLRPSLVMVHMAPTYQAVIQRPPVVPPASTAEIALAAGVLLLCLLLLVSALPMSIIAWKERT